MIGFKLKVEAVIEIQSDNKDVTVNEIITNIKQGDGLFNSHENDKFFIYDWVVNSVTEVLKLK